MTSSMDTFRQNRVMLNLPTELADRLHDLFEENKYKFESEDQLELSEAFDKALMSYWKEKEQGQERQEELALQEIEKEMNSPHFVEPYVGIDKRGEFTFGRSWAFLYREPEYAEREEMFYVHSTNVDSTVYIAANFFTECGFNWTTLEDSRIVHKYLEHVSNNYRKRVSKQSGSSPLYMYPALSEEIKEDFLNEVKALFKHPV